LSDRDAVGRTGRASMNIGRLVSDAAERYPDRPAILRGGEVTAYGEFAGRVDALSSVLASLGLRKGDRVALFMQNRPELLESFFAVWRLGCCVVPLNARFLPDEIVYHVEDSGARAIVFGKESRGAMEEVRAKSDVEREYVCLSEPAAGQRDYEALVSEHERAAPELAEVSGSDPAWLFYTSGTTGRPKGAVLTHDNLRFVTVGWCADLMHLEPEDVGLHAAPLTHGAGLHALALVAKGAAQVIGPSSFDPRGFCELVERHAVTNTWLVPTQIKRLATCPGLEGHDLSSLRYLVYGGSAMYVEDIKQALRRMGPIFVQLYGQGETPMTATYLRREEHIAEGPEELVARLASCGHARTGMEVAILDGEGREVPGGEMGEICVRGPSVFAGYWERPEETAETLKGGWLHTGDLGRIDGGGYVYIMDRKKDMIISGGSNVYPREVEEVLLKHPAVLEACVVGVPDPVWGEATKAVVVLDDGASANSQEVIGFCAERLADYKRPKTVDFVRELPKSPYGKTLKREVRSRYL
jgi:acyl-CoA synthetase (AMP-forming)/AMP-acid ligase II